MPVSYQDSLLAGLLVALLGAACSQVGQSRQSSVGGDDGEPAAASGSGGGSTGSTGNSTGSFLGGLPGTGTAASGTSPTLGTASGSSQNTGSTLPNSQSLEQCEAQNLAWIAVVNSGASPTTCGNPLVSWCCTVNEISARFPTMQAQLAAVFTNYITNQGEVLYACSVDTNNDYTFSMAKIVNGSTTYNTATISGVFPVNTNDPTNNCPAVTTPELEKTSLLLDGRYEQSDPAHEQSHVPSPAAPGIYQGSY